MRPLALIIALGAAWAIWTATGDLTCRAERIIDADTIVACGAVIRLRAVDAPETWRPECDAELAAGEAATTAVAALIAESGGVVTLSDLDPDEDPFGRIVADVLLSLPSGRINLGDWLLAEGHAQAWPGNRGWCE